MDDYLNGQVGKPIDDPQGFRAQQAARRVNALHRNGRTVEEYQVGFRDQCHVQLEIDERTRTIAGWRYAPNYSDADCYQSANVGPSRPK